MTLTREDAINAIGSRVSFDLADYPSGYAWGELPTDNVVTGVLHSVEGDAGIDWCFIRIDDVFRGDGGEYRHLPLDRTSLIVTLKRRHWDYSCWQDLGEIDPSNLPDPVKDYGGSLPSHVWPGGYPVVYVDPEDESEGLCVECVRAMISAGHWPNIDKPWTTVDSYTHYEGPAVECTCGKHIESAYGDPEANE